MEVVCNSSECLASFDITSLMFDINFIIIVNYEETLTFAVQMKHITLILWMCHYAKMFLNVAS